LERRPASANAAIDSIDVAYVRLVFSLAAFPERPPVHGFEAMKAARFGFGLLTELRRAFAI
jgi:hypothetical protein